MTPTRVCILLVNIAQTSPFTTPMTVQIIELDMAVFEARVRPEKMVLERRPFGRAVLFGRIVHERERQLIQISRQLRDEQV